MLNRDFQLELFTLESCTPIVKTAVLGQSKGLFFIWKDKVFSAW